MNNKVIYTCITGGYEKPTDNFPHKEGYDYILLSDVPIQTKSWFNKVLNFDSLKDLPPVKKQRFVKLFPDVFFPDYEISIWIDANTAIDDKLYNYIEKAFDNPITFKQHPERNCIYDELKANITCKKEKQEMVDYLTKRYQDEGMPRKFGLFETNVVVRQHNNEIVQTIMKLWFNEIKNHSHRDQLSLTYVLWKFNLMGFVHSQQSTDFQPKEHYK